MARQTVILLCTLLLLLLGGCTTPPVPIQAVTPWSQSQLPAETNTPSADQLPTPAAVAGVTRLPPTATPTPYAVREAQSETYAMVRATDQALVVTPETPVELPAEPVPLTFDEFFSGFDPDTSELVLSDKLMALDGRRVWIEGYMAPPLKLDLDWFQLTRIVVGGCVYCAAVEDWVPDIAQVYVENMAVPYTLFPLRVIGELHVGPSIDPETGMVSLVRIYADDIQVITNY